MLIMPCALFANKMEKYLLNLIFQYLFYIGNIIYIYVKHVRVYIYNIYNIFVIFVHILNTELIVDRVYLSCNDIMEYYYYYIRYNKTLILSL